MIGVREIAESQDIPVHFLSKILQQLVRRKILVSIKGRNGGFKLNQPAEQLYLLQIVEIIDGFDVFDLCGLGMRVCSDETPCPIHHEYQIVKIKVKELLLEKTLAELCEDVNAGKSIVTYMNN